MGTSAAVTFPPATRPDGDLCGGGNLSDGAGPGLAPLSGIAGRLRELTATAARDTALLGFGEAVDFAAGVEEITRAAEYLQVLAAGRGPDPHQRPRRGR